MTSELREGGGGGRDWGTIALPLCRSFCVLICKQHDIDFAYLLELYHDRHAAGIQLGVCCVGFAQPCVSQRGTRRWKKFM